MLIKMILAHLNTIIKYNITNYLGKNMRITILDIKEILTEHTTAIDIFLKENSSNDVKQNIKYNLENNFIKSISEFFNNLPNRDEFSELNALENYQLLNLQFGFKSENINPFEREFIDNLYYLYTKNNHVKIYAFYKNLYDKQLFSIEAYKFFHYTEFHSEARRGFVTFLIDVNLLTTATMNIVFKYGKSYRLDVKIWKTITPILDENLFNNVMQREDVNHIKKLAKKKFYNLPMELVQAILLHPNSQKIILLLRTKIFTQEADVRLLLSHKHLDLLDTILTRIGVKFKDPVKELLSKNENELEFFYKILIDLSPEQIRANLVGISYNSNLKILQKIINLQKNYYIKLHGNFINLSDTHLKFLEESLEKFSMEVLKQEMIDFIILAINDFKCFIYRLAMYFFSFNEVKRNQALILLNHVNQYNTFNNDDLLQWMIEYKNHSISELYYALIEFPQNANEVQLIARLKKYTQLPEVIYNKGHNFLRDLNEIYTYLQKMKLQFEIKKYIYEYLDFIIRQEENYSRSHKSSRITKEGFFANSQCTLQEFLTKYDKVIAMSPEYLKNNFANFTDFFNNYDHAFEYIYELFPKNCGAMLHKLLNTSIIQLTAILGKFSLIYYSGNRLTLIQNYILHQLTIISFTSPQLIKELFEYIYIIFYEISNDLGEGKAAYFKNIYNDLFVALDVANINQQYVIEQLRLVLAKGFAKKIMVPLENIINKDEKLSLQKICTISRTSERFYYNKYMPVLDALLQCYFTDMPLDRFLHDLNQSHAIGKQIAQNNQQTQVALQKAGVNLSLFLHYPYKQVFYVFGTKIRKCNEVTLKIWYLTADILKIITSLANINYKQPRLVIGIKTLHLLKIKIRNYRIQLLKKIKDKQLNITDTELLNFVRNDSNMNLLTGSVGTQLNKLMMLTCEELDKIPEWLQLQEKVQDLMQAINQLKELLKAFEDFKANKKKDPEWGTPREFYVKVWDKTNPMTYFLGNQLGCCLSTEKGEFPAIIQRIIDDAMLMVMVIDPQLNEVVAGFWLYVGIDSKTSTAYLVANFAEMRDAIARDNSLKEAVLIQLLKFTGEFAKKINLPFVLAPLNYGSIPNWKFCSQEYEFKKIGVMRINLNYDDYYLKSLQDINFYNYDETLLSTLYPAGNAVLSANDIENITQQEGQTIQSPLASTGLFGSQNKATTQSFLSPISTKIDYTISKHI